MSFVINLDLVRTLAAVATACDMMHRRVQHHGERTAYLALNIGMRYGLGQEQLQQLLLSALVHDVGVASTKEKLELADFQPPGTAISGHTQRGHDLLLQTRFLKELARPVLHHHDEYAPGMDILPAILCLADRVEFLLDREQYALWQVSSIVETVNAHKGRLFHPDLVECFTDLANTPSLWLDLESGNYIKLLQRYPAMSRPIGLDELEDIAELFAKIVDSKSPYTAMHSSGLADKVGRMAEIMGMGTEKTRQLRTAALLHDIGKLAVSEEILLYPGKLSKEDMDIMKQHSYHTYHLLGMIGEGVESIQTWAAYHHERLDGSGYPFSLTAEHLDIEARLVAVLDVFQALTEERPYRQALSADTAAGILEAEARAGRLDPDIVALVIDHRAELVNPTA